MGNPKRLLLLGGTTEASELAGRLASDPRFDVVLSLAGRTASPKLPPVAYRIGGFGGVCGLADWLVRESMDCVVDATHPFAARMSANAAAATRRLGVPLLTVIRPPWTAVDGDRWQIVPDIAGAVSALGPAPRRVWLTIGGNELAAFRAAPWHRYLVRAVDRPPADAIPPGAEILLARGPFDLAAERQLIATHRVEVLVTKNSGGAATAAKLAAAREAGLPVVMVARPEKASGETVADVSAALAWLDHFLIGRQ